MGYVVLHFVPQSLIIGFLSIPLVDILIFGCIRVVRWEAFTSDIGWCYLLLIVSFPNTSEQ